MIWGFFFLVIYGIHHFIIPSKDDFYFATLTDHQSLIDAITFRYSEWSSRVIIESILILISKSIIIWRILDTTIFVLLIWSINKIIFNEQNQNNIILCFCIVMVYPFVDMWSAGFIATTLNYFWPLTFLIVSIIPIINHIRGIKQNPWLQISGIFSSLFAINQEQVAGIAVILYVISITYCIVNKISHYYPLILLSISLASVIFIFTCPGNYNRLQNEVIMWFPNYFNLNILDKIIISFCNTSCILLNNFVIYALFCITSIVIILSNGNSSIKKKALPILFTILIFAIFTTRTYSILTHTYNPIFDCGLLPLQNQFYLGVSLVVVLIPLSITLQLPYSQNRVIISIILVIGLISNLIMGFSPTIFVSQKRAAIFLFFSFLISLLILLKSNKQSIPHWYSVATICFCIIYSSCKYYNLLSYIRYPIE